MVETVDNTLELQSVKVSAIKPYPNNPRKNDRAVNDVMESINQCGYCAPIICDENMVVLAGHTRLKAIKKLGWDSVNVIIKNGLTEEQKKKYRLLDNKTNELAEWNLDKLELELSGLDFGSYDFGFNLSFDEPPVVGEDDYDLDQTDGVEPRAKRGDVWKLGEHRVCCGDSTNADDIKKLMDGQHSRLLFTSPPYSDMRNYRGGKNLDEIFLSKFIPAYSQYVNIQAVNLGIQRRDNEVVEYWNAYIESARESGLKLLAWNVWDKMTAGSIGNQTTSMIPLRHEWIFVFGKEPVNIYLTWLKKSGSVKKNNGVSTPRDKSGEMKKTTSGVTNKMYKKMESVIEIPEQENLESVTKQRPEQGGATKKHPAVFPVFLPAEYIVAFTEKDDVVVEPFGGSGTTVIACEQLGRKCYAMELDEHYVDVILDRWEEFTGEKAVKVC